MKLLEQSLEPMRRAPKRTKAGIITATAVLPIALFYVTGGAITPAPATHPAAAQTAAAKQASDWSEVILQGLPGRPLTKADEAQIAKLGGKVYRHLGILSGGAVRIPTRNLTQLAALSFVKHVSPDMTVQKTDEFTIGHTGADSILSTLAITGTGLSGYGVTVAVLDSGVKASDDLKDAPWSGTNRILVAKNFVTGGGTNADDKLGHGTHVAGIVAGNGDASFTDKSYRHFYGVAPRSGVINARVLNDQGQGQVSDVIAAINWIVANKAAYKIRVLNISFGHPVYESYQTDPLNQAVEAAWKAGIVVVCAAGNSGRESDTVVAGRDNEGYGTAYGSIQVPGNDPYVITVGAMKDGGSRAADRIATYSSRGPSRIDMTMKPDIIAPGNRVISLTADKSVLDTQYGSINSISNGTFLIGGDNKPSNRYFRLSGTSMAAPVVSGAAALMLQKYPTLSPDTVKARLMFSADKWAAPSGATDPLTYGAGYLNIPAALSSTVVVPSTLYAASPSMTVASDGFMYVDMTQAIWSRTGTASPLSVWGTGALSTQILWGQEAISGGNIVSDTQAIWGRAEVVRANQAIWGRTAASDADLTLHTILGEN